MCASQALPQPKPVLPPPFPPEETPGLPTPVVPKTTPPNAARVALWSFPLSLAVSVLAAILVTTASSPAIPSGPTRPSPVATSTPTPSPTPSYLDSILAWEVTQPTAEALAERVERSIRFDVQAEARSAVATEIARQTGGSSGERPPAAASPTGSGW